MANASWIYAALAGFVVGILCVAVPDTFLDDLSERFLWTKGGYYWTKARLGLAAAGFRVLRRCKTTISAWAESLAIATPEIGAFPGRLVAGVQQQGLTPRANALSYAPSIRRWGERFLPHAAVGSIQLKPAQQRAVSALTADPASELTRGQYEQLAGVSRSQAAYDLAELVEVGLLDRVGNGRATRYRLAREGGAQRHWTSDRIRTELEAFCAGRNAWPSAADFKAAGRGDLYVAASRYGGIGHWAEALGFERSPQGASPAPEPEPSPARAKLAWAGGGALVALAVAVAVGAIVVTATRRHPAAPVAKARHGALSAEAKKQTTRPARSTAKKAAPSHVRKVRRQRAHHPTLRTRLRPTSSRAVRASRTTEQPSSTSVVAETRTFSAVTPTHTSGPAPLPAPSGSSPPNPLKAP